MRSLIIFLICVFAVPLACGCTGSPSPAMNPSFDSDKAKQALTTVLDAWKQGKVSALPKQKPPIRFVDEDYIHGMRLTNYRIVQSDAPIRPFEGVAVELDLVNRQGQAI